MKRFVILLILASTMLLGGCSQSEPEGLIPREELVPVLKDVFMAQSYVNRNRNQFRLEVADSALYVNRLVENHGYTIQQYDSTIMYYSRNLKKLDEIIDQVIEIITEEEQSLQNLENQ